MKAIRLDSVGGPEEPAPRGLPAPVAAEGQFVVEVRASANVVLVT